MNQDEEKTDVGWIQRIIEACQIINIAARALEIESKNEKMKKYYDSLFKRACAMEEEIKIYNNIPLF